MWIARDKDGRWHAFKEKPVYVHNLWSSDYNKVHITFHSDSPAEDSLEEFGSGMWEATDADHTMYIYGEVPIVNNIGERWDGDEYFELVMPLSPGWQRTLKEL